MVNWFLAASAVVCAGLLALQTARKEAKKQCEAEKEKERMTAEHRRQTAALQKENEDKESLLAEISAENSRLERHLREMTKTLSRERLAFAAQIERTTEQTALLVRSATLVLWATHSPNPAVGVRRSVERAVLLARAALLARASMLGKAATSLGASEAQVRRPDGTEHIVGRANSSQAETMQAGTMQAETKQAKTPQGETMQIETMQAEALMELHLLHTKARSRDHPEYPERHQVPDSMVHWRTPYTSYEPSGPWTHDDVLANDCNLSTGNQWADPVYLEQAELEQRFTYSGDGKKRPLGDAVRFEGGLPLNPAGRTGLRGRGLLGKWGPNHAADPIVTRKDPKEGRLQVVVIQRKDTKQARK